VKELKKLEFEQEKKVLTFLIAMGKSQAAINKQM